MSSDTDPSPVPSHWEFPTSGTDPVPYELIEGPPRYRCSEDGTRVYSLADVAAHDAQFHQKTDGAAGRPEPDQSMIRMEALARAVEAQRGPEDPDALIARAEAILDFLNGRPVEYPGTVVLTGADIVRLDDAIVRGGLRADDDGDVVLGRRIVDAIAQQKDAAWEAGDR